MRSLRKQPASTDRVSTVYRAVPAQSKLRDALSRVARKAGEKVGNQELEAKLKYAGNLRDVLLEFTGDRLRNMHTIQRAELAAMGDWRRWFRRVAKGRPGYFLPDATRWHEAAKLYKQAGNALAHGDVHRGAQLLERATEAERAALRTVPKQVEEHLSETSRAMPTVPAELPHASAGMSCAPIAAPASLRYADLILDVSDEMLRVPPSGGRRRWWDDSLEGEEGEEKEDGEEKEEGAAGEGTQRRRRRRKRDLLGE